MPVFCPTVHVHEPWQPLLWTDGIDAIPCRKLAACSNESCTQQPPSRTLRCRLPNSLLLNAPGWAAAGTPPPSLPRSLFTPGTAWQPPWDWRGMSQATRRWWPASCCAQVRRFFMPQLASWLLCCTRSRHQRYCQKHACFLLLADRAAACPARRCFCLSLQLSHLQLPTCCPKLPTCSP